MDRWQLEHKVSGSLLQSRKRKQALLESNLPGILDPTHQTDVSQREFSWGKRGEKGQPELR